MLRSNCVLAYLATAVEVAIVGLTAAEVVSGSFATVAAWVIASCAYLAVGFALTWRSTETPRATDRVGVLDTLSWVLPIAASAGGINAALLVIRGPRPLEGGPWMLLVGATGILVSWGLLHSGFAQVYEGMQARAAGGVFQFPETRVPNFADFLYFSFTVGTTFATSDAQVSTSRARLVVMVHSVVGFFYNTLVVAIAFQVLQKLARQA